MDSLYLSPIEKYFTAFSTNSESSFYYFDIDLNEYKLFDKVKFKKLQDAMCLTVLNESYLMLLSGGYDSLINVHLIMRIKSINKHLITDTQNNIKPVQFKLSIKAHLNDIRDISAVSPFTDPTDEFFFATCSQDTYIRIWQINKMQVQEQSPQDVFEEYKSKTSYVISAENDYFNILLDSVLGGHEDAVSSVRWGFINNQPVLLSSSFDFSVGLWMYDKKYVFVFLNRIYGIEKLL